MDKLLLSILRTYVWGILGEFLHPTSQTGLNSLIELGVSMDTAATFVWDILKGYSIIAEVDLLEVLVCLCGEQVVLSTP